MIDEKRLEEIEAWHNDVTSPNYLSHDDFDELIRLARLGLHAHKLADEVRKVLPKAPSMDGKTSWSQCQRIVDRALSEFNALKALPEGEGYDK